jgi:transcription termination factor Rho
MRDQREQREQRGPIQGGGQPQIQGEPVVHDGWLEVSEKGFGFLRSAKGNYSPKPTDVFLTPDSIKRLALREGCHIKCTVNPPHRGNSPQLREVLEVSGRTYQDYLHSIRFENLTTIDPIEKYLLETAPDLVETRIIDLVTPIGKGTRGLIVAPPRTGKTTILKQICNAITTNHPDVHAMVLLIDERPEEVTDFQRSVKAEVVASSNDQDLETHVRLSRFMIERCRRMVEAGKDVFVLLDSITRVARAYNSVHGGSGRTMTGGVDARALEIPRKMFAAARKVEEGGSLTILATALIDTGSRMDELIFQEFKGTGNMELVLERKLSDRRLFPAIDIPKSGTRKEEKLFPPKHMEAIRKLRRMMTDLQPVEAMETLLSAIKKYKTNEELLAKLS